MCSEEYMAATSGSRDLAFAQVCLCSALSLAAALARAPATGSKALWAVQRSEMLFGQGYFSVYCSHDAA
jgi:hypothetical protein